MLDDDDSSSSGWLLAPISWSNLIDRISILTLKLEHTREASRAANVARELDVLSTIRDRCMPVNANIDTLVEELASANRQLWESEDAIRMHEARRDYGPGFVAVARAIYQQNDRRSRIKAKIDHALDSELVEIKIYGDD
jgi:hypothetical protein